MRAACRLTGWGCIPISDQGLQQARRSTVRADLELVSALPRGARWLGVFQGGQCPYGIVADPIARKRSASWVETSRPGIGCCDLSGVLQRNGDSPHRTRFVDWSESLLVSRQALGRGQQKNSLIGTTI